MKALVIVIWVVTAAVAVTTVDKILKQQSLKSVVTDSVKIPVMDTLLVIKHDTVKVTNSLKDTTKLVHSDTAHGLKYDTLLLKTKRK